MTRKKLYIISLPVLAVILAALLFAAAFNASAKKQARILLEKEISEINSATEIIDGECGKIEAQLDEVETELSTKSTINNYYMEYKKTYDDLKAEVDSLKAESASLDEQIAAKRGELESAGGSGSGKRGAAFLLSANETYECPKDIPAGRYTASGKGTLTILSSTGKVRLSQNLDVAYGNSYTFNLSSGEKIKVTEEVTLTELK